MNSQLPAWGIAVAIMNFALLPALVVLAFWIYRSANRAQRSQIVWTGIALISFVVITGLLRDNLPAIGVLQRPSYALGGAVGVLSLVAAFAPAFVVRYAVLKPFDLKLK
jgi:hypothetical protein